MDSVSAPPPMADEDSPAWADLPVAVLTQIFDVILRAPMPHPEYLQGKLESWCSLFQICRQWRLAIKETGVGVCLPKRISKRMEQWLRQARIRGLELHDPDHTDPSCYSKLLSDPLMLKSSGEALQSIVDVPFNGTWNPSDFKNLSQLVIRRASSFRVPPAFDLRVVASMQHLKVLVLGSGFNGMQNLDCLPSCCKTLVISCPGHPQDSHLQIPSWPADKHLEWLSLSAHTLQMDMQQLKGHVRQLNIHTAYLFLEVPSFAGAMMQTAEARRSAADAALGAIAESIVNDTALVELQLNCEAVLLGCRPLSDEVNTSMLAGSANIDIHQYYVEICNHQIDNALEQASLQRQALPSARDRVQLHTVHHGPELEVTLLRIKEGEKNALALRLDLPGMDLEQEVTALLQQLADNAPAVAAAAAAAEQRLGGVDAGTGAAAASYRCVAFPPWSYLHTQAEAAEAAGPDQGGEGSKEEGGASTAAGPTPAAPGSSAGAGPGSAAALAQPAGTSSCSAAPSPSAECSAAAMRMVELQSRLLSSAAFVEGSVNTLYEINGLLMPPNPRSLRSLLSPFLNLSALFATTMSELLPNKDVLPMVLQELHLTAGTPRQRFTASAISNLTELRRMSLRGYCSYDLACMPAVRPGFGLALLDPCPSRSTPLGNSSVDTLMPKGRIVDISINISSELPTARPPAPAPATATATATAPGPPAVTTAAGSPAAQEPSASPPVPSPSPSAAPPPAPPAVPSVSSRPVPQGVLAPLAVDIAAWAPLGHGLHVHCNAGVSLHAPQDNVEEMMSYLAASGLDHFVVVVQLLQDPGDVDIFLQAMEGISIRTFKVVLGDNQVLDGMELMLSVAAGNCPDWSVHWNMMEGQQSAAGYVPFHGEAAWAVGQQLDNLDLHDGEQVQGPGNAWQQQGAAVAAADGVEGEEQSLPVLCMSFHRRRPYSP